jgi:Ner family transcriptional regulator
MTKKTNLKDWSRKKILAALEEAGWKTLRALAEHHKVGLSTLSTALFKPAPVSEERIAEAIGVHPSAIWPSRYAEDGSSNRLPKGHKARRICRLPKSLPQPYRRAT